VQVTVNELKPQIKQDNMKAISTNCELQELDVKVDKIVIEAKNMEDDTQPLDCESWVKKYKWALIITSIVLVVILIVLICIGFFVVNGNYISDEGLMGNNTMSNNNTNTTNTITNIIFMKP